MLFARAGAPDKLWIGSLCITSLASRAFISFLALWESFRRLSLCSIELLPQRNLDFHYLLEGSHVDDFGILFFPHMVMSFSPRYSFWCLSVICVGSREQVRVGRPG